MALKYRVGGGWGQEHPPVDAFLLSWFRSLAGPGVVGVAAATRRDTS